MMSPSSNKNASFDLLGHYDLAPIRIGEDEFQAILILDWLAAGPFDTSEALEEPKDCVGSLGQPESPN